jgi:hypothetical protein
VLLGGRLAASIWRGDGEGQSKKGGSDEREQKGLVLSLSFLYNDSAWQGLLDAMWPRG